jgi:stage III sporulation protein AH
MNSKRQTIWLVSMLSLMVVLSAYYLLTDETTRFHFQASEVDQQSLKSDQNSENLASSDVKVQIQEMQNAAPSSSSSHISATEDAILQQWQTQQSSHRDYFVNLQMKRHEEWKKKTEKLMSTITDHQQKPETVANATNELETLSDLQEKIDNLEETLLKDFPQAVIVKEGEDWKVTVQAKKLEKMQGVNIIDMMINQFQARPEHIQVRYIHP